MVEIVGNLWDWYEKPNTVILITTNGFVKSDGCGVMGRGCAREARDRVPAIARLLGALIRKNGNVLNQLTPDVLAFPVKHDWREKADIVLIRQSALALKKLAMQNTYVTYVLPRPGCGSGQLNWDDVRPTLRDLPDNVKVITWENKP